MDICLPSQEGSGLKRNRDNRAGQSKRLPSQEGSGLKQLVFLGKGREGESSLARGKWIEALTPHGPPAPPYSLPSQEGSGLKQLTLPPLLAEIEVFPRKREVD